MINISEIFSHLEPLVAERVRTSHTSTDARTILDFGEDALRYDFFFSVVEQMGLRPSNVLLEVPYPDGCYLQVERHGPGQGRRLSKPEIDLVVTNSNHQPIAAMEFALFKQTPIAAVQDRSGRAGKMLNDITRLSSLRLSQAYDGVQLYFVVLTDREMLNYGSGSRGRKAVPVFQDLVLSDDFLSHYPRTTTEKIEGKFRDALNGRLPTARIAAEFGGAIGGRGDNEYRCFVFEVGLS